MNILKASVEERFEAFLKFLEETPNQAFNFMSVHNCAIAQFGRSLHGNDFNSAGSESYAINSINKRIQVLPDEIPCDPLMDFYTFGEAAREFRKLMKKGN